MNSKQVHPINSDINVVKRENDFALKPTIIEGKVAHAFPVLSCVLCNDLPKEI